MAVFDGLAGLDFAYKGYQYPLPPSWKRAIRLEDQINWLLQALEAINENGINDSELESAIAIVRDNLQKQIDDLQEGWKSGDSALEEQIKNITLGLFLVHNPVTGSYDYTSAALRQMYDTVRPFTATYADLDYLGIEEATAHGTAQVKQYLRYEDLDGLLKNDTYGITVHSLLLVPSPAPDSNGRMITAEQASTDEICYQSLDLYGRFVILNCISTKGKDTSLLDMVNNDLNCSITPAAAIIDKEPGYSYGPNIFTTYGEMDTNGVLGYKEKL